MEEEPTIVEYFAEHERYRCGYCGSKDTNYSHGMWAHQMSVQDYQDLIDRGWRRSGKYCYKPTMNMTCCPQYTISNKVLEFKLNKSHKKAIKRVNRFLITGVKPGHSKDEESKEDEDREEQGATRGVETALAEKAVPSEIVKPKKVKSKDSQASSSDLSASGSTVTSSSASLSNTSDQSNSGPSISQEKKSETSKSMASAKPVPKPGTGPDPNKPRCRKAKELRAERKAMKQSKAGDSSTKQKKSKQPQEKSLEDYLSEPDHAQNPAHKLEILLCRSSPESQPFHLSFLESYSVYRKYQMAIHKDPPEECDKMGFRNFLVDSPLEEKYKEDGPPQGYGSFHQHYLLDGKLIAVGVVDILPKCVSSVYLYYDPEYSFLGLGVYSALREIALTRQLNCSAPKLKYYYMGFYIHTCPKMRYKGQYIPSFLVCPESYQWVPIEKCRPKLDASAYARLSEEGVEDKDKDIDINQVLVLHQGTMLPYAFYKMMKSKGSDEPEVKEYAGFVGKTCAERMLLVRK